MMFPNGLGHPSAIIDLWDMTNDVRLAWCFMTLRDGYLDVEDSLLGRASADRATRTASSDWLSSLQTKKTFNSGCGWRTPTSDHARRIFGPINDFVRATALKMRPSRCSWAAFVAY
jgi:hypothetical protein